MSKPKEGATPREEANYKLGVIMMCHVGPSIVANVSLCWEKWIMREAVGVWEQGCYVHATVKKDAINSSQTSPGASLLCVPPGVSLIPVTETFAHFFLFFSILTGLLEGRSHTSFRYGTKYSAGNKTYTTVQEGRVG